MAYELLDAAPKGRYEILDEPVAVKAGNALNDIPRQLGLAARYGLEGVSNTAQLLTEPLRYLTDRATGQTGKTKPLGVLATQAADWMGLPQPQGVNERVIGDASRLMAGSGGLTGAANLAAKIPGMVGQGAAFLAANPMQQIAAAAGAGTAGGASREAGGDGWAQGVASLLGGVAGGLAPGAINSTYQAAKGLVTPAMKAPSLDAKIGAILEKSGVDYSQVPERLRQSMRAEMAKSLKAGDEFSPDAVRRLLDFKTTGTTPTRGMVSQDPVQITREMNLAKTGANSADNGLQGMALLQNQNNATLISRLNDVGGRSETIPLVAGQAVKSRIEGTYAGFQSAEKAAWESAKGNASYTRPVYPDGLNAMNRALGDEGMMGFMPKPITDYMAAFQTGQQPYTPQAYRNLQSMLSGAMKEGGNTAAAAGIARKALEASPLRPITQTGRDMGQTPITSQMAQGLRDFDGESQTAIEAVNVARGATSAKYQYADSSPLVKTALSNSRTADPENLAKSFVLNGTLNDARSVAKEVGADGIATIRDAIATHIKKQTLGGASDEVGKVSQSALNRTISGIGEDKLKLFFSPEEVNMLKATGRVASYMQVQPVGSAVNNSNSGALLLGRGMDLLDKTPFLGPMLTPALKNINGSLQNRQAQNILPGLLAQQIKEPTGQGLLLPSMAFGGLLAAPRIPSP